MSRKVIFLLGILIFPVYLSAHSVSIYFFWGDGCPHCAKEKPFLEEMKKKYPQIEIKEFEVWKNSFNLHFLKRMANAYGISGDAIPCTFIGDTVFEGFAEEYKEVMEKKIVSCIEQKCFQPAEILNQPELLKQKKQENTKEILLPFLGKIDTEAFALPVLTIIIAGLDSFNPCAFFVLFILLGMLVHARSRKRMLFIGLVFVFFSGFIYFLFMAAWFNLFYYVGNVSWITLLAGIIALLIAFFNIKDFFFFKKGLSLTIPEKAKPKLFDRMRRLVKAESFISMVIGTVVLAILANTYELLCTAGFPMVYTKILTQNQLSGFSYYLYLVFYNLIYVIPLMIIVVVFTITLGSRKLTEKQGQNLKLISGLMMLALGIVLVIAPSYLNNFIFSILLLLGVLLVSFIIIKLKNKK